MWYVCVYIYIYIYIVSKLRIFFFTKKGGTHGVIVTVIENGHGKRSSNPEWGCLNPIIFSLAMGK